MSPQLRVEDVPDRCRFEAHLDDELAGHLAYSVDDGVVTMPSTFVDPRHEGHGVGSALARAALDQARDRGMKVRPVCWFVAGWVERHPDYGDLLA
jgi:uncharacterized protein